MKWLLFPIIALSALCIGYFAVGQFFEINSGREVDASTNLTSEVLALENPDVYTGVFETDQVTSLSQQINNSFDPLDRAGDYLRLNAQIARASEVQLISLLDDSDLKSLGSETLDLIYQQWAKLKPDRAAADWLQRSQSHKDLRLPISGLMKEWVEQSSNSAAQWIDSIEGKSFKETAEINYLQELAKIEPMRAIDRFLENDTSPDLIYIAGSLYSNLSADQFPTVVSKILDHPNQEKNKSILNSLFTRWQSKTPGALRQWVESNRSEESIPTWVVPSAARSLAKTDPQYTAEWIAEMSVVTDKRLKSAVSEAWIRWVASGENIEAAEKWVNQNGQHLSNKQINEDLFGPNSLELLGLVDNISNQKFKAGFQSMILKSATKGDPLATMQFVQDEIPDGKEKDKALQTVISNWSKNTDPKSVVDWVVNNIPEENGRSQATRAAVSQWASVDPNAAVKFAIDLPEADREDIFRKLSYSPWFRNDPDSVLGFISEVKEPEKISKLTQRFFANYAKNQSLKVAQSTAEKLPTEQARADAMHGLFSSWGGRDSEVAAKALDQMTSGPARDAGVEAYIGSVSSIDRKAAVVWATTISDPKKRDALILSNGFTWLWRNKSEATTWLENSTEISEEIKQQLLPKK